MSAESAPPTPAIRIAPGQHEEPREALPAPDTDTLAGLSVASVVAQVEQGALDEDIDSGRLLDLDAAQDAAIPPAQVEAVLETEPVDDWRHAPKISRAAADGGA